MWYILIAILFNIGIFLSFRAFGRFGIPTLQAITWNYLAGALFGMLFRAQVIHPGPETFSKPWFPFAVFLSFLFVITFLLLNETTKRFNVTVTSVSNKIALIVPVLSSIFILKTEQNSFGPLQWLGLVLALAAIIFTSVRPKTTGLQLRKPWEIIFPLLVFAFGGTIDSMVNYTNFYHLGEQESGPFAIWLFALSFIIALVYMLIRKEQFQLKALLWGLILGACNYFSLHFVLKALDALGNNGALFYPLFNIGVILGASLFAFLIFKDKLMKINLIGLVLAVLALVILALRVGG